MPSLREAATQALEAMESADVDPHSSDAVHKAIDALKAALVEDALQRFTDVNQEIEAALAEPVQDGCNHCNHPMYAAIKCRVCGRVQEPTPPQRKPLTEEEIAELARQEQFLLVCDGLDELTEIARAVERAHGIGGEG